MKTRLLIIMSLGIFGFFALSFLLSPSIFGEPYCTDGRFNTDCKSWNNWEWIYYNLSGYRDYPPPLNLSEINLQRVLNHCNDTTSDAKTDVGLEYQNSTHYINNTNCEWHVSGKWTEPIPLLYESDVCDKQILEYLYRSSNLLDENFDGNYFQKFIGLPDGVSKEKFEECVDFIYDKRTTPSTWINIRMENLTRYVELGSSPTFRVVESGWGSSCTSPTLEVYYMKQEFDTDPPIDDLIYKHRIVYPCPNYEPIYPPPDVLRIWDESDFPEFPICEEEGKYLIIGDSGYERLTLYYYYCGIENEN